MLSQFSLGFVRTLHFESHLVKIPLADWLWAIVAASTSLYMFLLYDELSLRAAAPLPQDMAVAAVGAVCLLEAVRRTVGMSLVIVAAVLLFIFLLVPTCRMLSLTVVPVSLGRGSHVVVAGEGAYLASLAISSSVVFLFVMFGAMLEKAGAGDWFIKTSFALTWTFARWSRKGGGSLLRVNGSNLGICSC